jgi:hypothetical protein
MINIDMMVLQNCTDLGNAVPGPCAETCTTSHDATQAMNMKCKEISDEDNKGDAMQMTFPKIKVEHEVSCMSVFALLGRYHKYVEVQIISFISISLSVHMNQLPFVHWILKSFFCNVLICLQIMHNCLTFPSVPRPPYLLLHCGMCPLLCHTSGRKWESSSCTKTLAWPPRR